MLQSCTEEDDIVIVDGDRGRVYVAPDAATVARYQAPFTLARRFFPGEAGIWPPVLLRTTASMAVLCYASTLAQAEAAMQRGADGLVVPENNNDFLGGDTLAQTAGEQAQLLADLAQMIGGQAPDPGHSPGTPGPDRPGAGRGSNASVIWCCATCRNWEELQARLDEIETELEDSPMPCLAGSNWTPGIAAAGENDDLPETLDGCAGSFVTGHACGTLRGSGCCWHRVRPARRASPSPLSLNGDWWPQVSGRCRRHGLLAPRLFPFQRRRRCQGRHPRVMIRCSPP